MGVLQSWGVCERLDWWFGDAKPLQEGRGAEGKWEATLTSKQPLRGKLTFPFSDTALNNNNNKIIGNNKNKSIHFAFLSPTSALLPF